MVMKREFSITIDRSDKLMWVVTGDGVVGHV